MTSKRTTLHVVLLPAWFATRKIPYGGAFVHAQALALRRHTDVEVGIIYQAQDAQPVQPPSDEGIHFHLRHATRLPKVGMLATTLWQWRYARLMAQYIRKFGRPDIVHAHGYVAGLAASYIQRQMGIPFVLTEHTSNILTGSVPHRHVKWLHRVYQDAHDLFAVSHALREKMMDYTRRPLHVLANCYDERIYYHVPERTSRGFEFITVTSLVAVKCLGLLIESFAALPRTDVRLRIVGHGPLEQPLKDQCRQLGVQDRVVFTGALDPPEIARLLQSAQVFVSSSSVETFGVAMIEAMACGLPVICTQSGGPADYVTRSVGKLIATNNKEHLMRAMDEMIQEYAQYNSAEIARHTKSHYSGHMLAARLNGIYEKTLANVR